MAEKRRIVFINQATGYLTIDIINAFAQSEKFEHVALIAGSIRVQDVPLHERVAWSKIALYDRGGARKKFLSWLKGTFQVAFLLITRYRKYEIFYITIPPFAYLLSWILPNKFSVLVFDVYPDVLQIFNVRTTHPIYRLWVRLNKVVFRKAHRVYTIGSGMATLLQHYMEASRITIIPLWTGLTNIKQINRADNSFIQEHGLQHKFIVQYSGNIGYTHNVEVLVDIAIRMQTTDDVFFLIIGRGEKFNYIQKLVAERQLTNCKLLPFQPDHLLNYTLSAADLGVVLLDDKTAHVSLPSKIYNLQAVGVAVLGIADTSSELAHHLQVYDNGSCFSPRDVDGIISFIQSVKSDNLMHERMRANSKQAMQNFTSANATLYYVNYVQ
jgi:hypothetical protein